MVIFKSEHSCVCTVSRQVQRIKTVGDDGPVLLCVHPEEGTSSRHHIQRGYSQSGPPEYFRSFTPKRREVYDRRGQRLEKKLSQIAKGIDLGHWGDDTFLENQKEKPIATQNNM